ncbi:hypothetical protein EV122DRAFT_256340 [Schizophyllum commune]
MIAKLSKSSKSGGSNLLFCLHPAYNFNASFRQDALNASKQLASFQRDFANDHGVAATTVTLSLLQATSRARDSLDAGLAHNRILNNNLETYNEQVQLILAAPTTKEAQMMAREQLVLDYAPRMELLQRMLPKDLGEPIIASFKQAILNGNTSLLAQHVSSATDFAKSKRIRGVWKTIEEGQSSSEIPPPCDWQTEKQAEQQTEQQTELTQPPQPRDIKAPLGRTRSKTARFTNAATAKASGQAVAPPALKGANALTRKNSAAAVPAKTSRDSKRYNPRQKSAGAMERV